MSKLKESQHLKITFEVIKEATQNFKTCIGKGGYGRVYKGQLLISGQLTTVAVKRLYEQFGQGSKEFLTEFELLKGQKHPNLISLLGCCEEQEEKIIVYEYAERGSLDRYIRHDKTTRTLSWLERLRICIDIARGLDHLHNHVGKHEAIIHGDIKSSNILLHGDLVAKISDLGLSKLTFAGLDGKLTKEADVFSFGMVLLEVLCGRLCTIRDDDGLLLSDYYKKKKIHTIIDPSLREQLISDSLLKFLSTAYGCLHEDREQRHPIYHVVKELEDALELEGNEDGKRSQLVPESPFTELVTRRTNVGKIFDMFDLNKDGGLSRKEVAAFLFVTKHDEEQHRTSVDEVFSLYHKYIDGQKGLTYHGLLQYYDDDHSDLDSDIVPLLSNSDDSNKRKKLKLLSEKLNSNKDAGLSGQALAASHKPVQKIGNLPVKAFNWYRRRGLASSSLLTKDGDDDTRDEFDLDSDVLELLLKPDGGDDGDDTLLLERPRESEHKVEPLTTRAKVLVFLIILLILSLTRISVKLKYLLVLSLIFLNSFNVFLK